MIDDTCLFHASVPVLRHYVAQSMVIVSKIAPGQSDLLARPLTKDGFGCGEHIWIAQNFAMRGVCPVCDVTAPDLGEAFASVEDLRVHGDAVLEYLSALSVQDFKGAAGRGIEHRAGHAELRQPGADYLLRFIIPNMLFHLVTAYSILRQDGIDLGKADFDGLHAYPAGFAF